MSAYKIIPPSPFSQSAYRTINSMPPESVFQVLKHHLPYKETRKYIVKVTKHLENYRNLLA